MTREALRIKAKTSEEEAKGTVCWDFEFLDPGDGGVLEVLHNGSDEAPKYTGTIIGLPKGLRYRQLLGPYIRSERRIILSIFAGAVVGGVAMMLQGNIRNLRGTTHSSRNRRFTLVSCGVRGISIFGWGAYSAKPSAESSFIFRPVTAGATLRRDPRQGLARGQAPFDPP